MRELGVALKEWSAVTNALAAGDQLVLIRKGGIAEKRFDLPAERFLLFPTQFHQPENQFRPEFVHHVTGQESEIDGSAIQVWGEVVRVYRVEDLEKLTQLTAHVIFTEQTIRDRYAFRPRQAMHVLALRAFRLPAPVVLPPRDEYAGCRSWIDVDSVSIDGSLQVLDDAELARRLGEIDQLLGG